MVQHHPTSSKLLYNATNRNNLVVYDFFYIFLPLFIFFVSYCAFSGSLVKNIFAYLLSQLDGRLCGVEK